MRTWSVSGTAFALCTRSSSLSIRTRTSMCFSLLLGADGGAGAAVREQLPEAPRHSLGHELLHLPAERRDLLHAARADEAHVRARHHVDRLDVRGERSVELVHL